MPSERGCNGVVLVLFISSSWHISLKTSLSYCLPWSELKSYVVGAPFERIATDIAGPFPTTKKGNRYILVVGDYFTKLTELYAMPDMKAETVADIIFRAWIKRYGCPIEIHSDQGRLYDFFYSKCLPLIRK
jgi:hypothetical protein